MDGSRSTLIDGACCGAPAEPQYHFSMRGVDFDGTARTFYFIRWLCVAGHSYDAEQL
jgi:hypothetical protein